MTERCLCPIWAHVRDGRRNVGFMVCERHVSWADAELERQGYRPLHILAKQGTAAQREWISGCEGPQS
jgi:hypothetical protein